MPPRVKDREFMTVARNVVEKAIAEHLDGTPLGVREFIPIC
jgi:hypothetical protein